MSDVNSTGAQGSSDAGANAEVAGESQESGVQADGGEGTSGDSGAGAGKSLKDAVANQLKKYKLKVNGKEREYDERMVQVLAQKGLAADEKFQMSAAERKKAEKILKLAKEDPDAFIREIRGEDPVEYHKARLAEEIKRLSMDPKDREIAEYKKKLEQFEKEKADREQKEKEAKMKEASDKFLSHYENEISKHIKAAKLPATEQTIAYAAEILLNGIEGGFEPPMEVVMEMVKERYVNDYRNLIGSAGDDDLLALLGDDTIKRILVANGKRSSSPVPRDIARESQSVAEPEEKKKPKQMSREEFEKYISDWAKRP